MKRIHAEILIAIIFIVLGTFFVYNFLFGVQSFWHSQNIWTAGLLVGWCIVAGGYWNQGWMVRESKSATHVSLILPINVFIVQCILFVKGVYYQDVALIFGAIIVNSAVIFNIYQIMRFRKKNN